MHRVAKHGGLVTPTNREPAEFVPEKQHRRLAPAQLDREYYKIERDMPWILQMARVVNVGKSI